MKRLHELLGTIFFVFALAAACHAGPTVAPHPKTPEVKVWDDKFVIVQVIKDPKTIKVMQDIFLRSTRVGDTTSHLKTPTHKIDFSDRWLLDLKNGEIGVLSKAVVDVYQIQDKDLEALRKLIETKA